MPKSRPNPHEETLLGLCTIVLRQQAHIDALENAVTVLIANGRPEMLEKTRQFLSQQAQEKFDKYLGHLEDADAPLSARVQRIVNELEGKNPLE